MGHLDAHAAGDWKQGLRERKLKIWRCQASSSGSARWDDLLLSDLFLIIQCGVGSVQKPVQAAAQLHELSAPDREDGRAARTGSHPELALWPMARRLSWMDTFPVAEWSLRHTCMTKK